MTEFEHATALKHVLLKSQETVSGVKGYIAIGTSYTFGEEIVSKGRVSLSFFIQITELYTDASVQKHRKSFSIYKGVNVPLCIKYF